MKKIVFFALVYCFLFISTVHADVLGVYSFEGTLGDKIPAKLKFAVIAFDGVYIKIKQ